MANLTISEAILETMVTSDSVAEPSAGETAWTSGATFGLGDRAIVGAPTSTVTISAATPAVVSWAANGLPDDTPVYFTTTGALPTGLSPNVTYYVTNRASGSFQLALTPGGAPIATTAAGSGDHTAVASIHRIFESLEASNINNPPAINSAKWAEVGPTNKWAKFDLYRPSVSWGASPMTFQLTPGKRIRSLFLGSLDAESARVVVKVGGVTKFDRTIALWSRQTFTPTDFCFKAWNRRADLLLLDLPLYSNPVIEVTLTKSTGLVGVGEVVIGNHDYLGKTRRDMKVTARNYTTFDRRTDGTATKPRRYRNVQQLQFTALFEKSRTQSLLELRERINGQVVVISALDNDEHPYFPAGLILGLVTTFDPNPDYESDGVLSVVAEEN